MIGRLKYDDGLCVSESDGEVLNDAVYDPSRMMQELSRMRDMEDDFGVMPMPKFDEAQENDLSTPGAGINFYAIPVSAGDTECTSAVSETLAVLGQRDVMPACTLIQNMFICGRKIIIPFEAGIAVKKAVHGI